MPYYKVNIGAYRLDVFGDNVDKALDNLGNIRFYPIKRIKKGNYKEGPDVILYKKPLKE